MEKDFDFKSMISNILSWNDEDSNNYMYPTYNTTTKSLKGTYKNLTENAKEATMKKCEVCMPDGNGKTKIGENCFFISPTNSGFMLYTNPDDQGIEIHCFETFKGVVKYLQSNEAFDLTDNKVANVI